MNRADQPGARVEREVRGAQRVVVVSDNPLIVAAIRSGVRQTGDIALAGYVDPRRATAARITEVGADVVLVDEAEKSEPAIAVIRALNELDESITVIVLTIDMHGEWLQRAFEAGANCAMSKAIHPQALATLLREAVHGHIVHSPAQLRSVNRAPLELATEHLSLTDRELEILHLVASGATNAEIARQPRMTHPTVKFHVSNVYRKLDVANRTEACHYAHVNGLVAARGNRCRPYRRRRR